MAYIYTQCFNLHFSMLTCRQQASHGRNIPGGIPVSVENAILDLVLFIVDMTVFELYNKCNQTSPSNEFALQLHGSTFMFSVPACHGSISIFGIHICFCHVSGDCANTEAGLVGHTAVAGRDPWGTAGSSQSWRLPAGERCMGWIWLDIEKHWCFCLSTMLRTSAWNFWMCFFGSETVIFNN